MLNDGSKKNLIKKKKLKSICQAHELSHETGVISWKSN
jgi:hypothetical protein